MPEHESLEVGTSRPRFNLAMLPEIEEIAAPSRPSVTPERPAPAPVSEAPPAAGATLTSGGDLAQIVHELRFDPSETLLRPGTTSTPDPNGGERHPAPPRVEEMSLPTVARMDVATPGDAHSPLAAPPAMAVPAPMVENVHPGEEAQPGPDSAPSRLVRLVRALGADAPLPTFPLPDPAGV